MKSNSAVARKASTRTRKIKETDFKIVAVGASAGGLEAMSTLLKALPVNTGMAYIFVQHLSATKKSFLVSILSKSTSMKVQGLKDFELIKPNNVYVVPNNKGTKVTDGHIKLLSRSKHASNTTIDVLFASLAESHKESAIGVILSGAARDGTLGVKAIKKAGGLTFAQDSSAEVSSMPESAIASGAIDYTLSPKDIAKKLASLSRRGVAKKKDGQNVPATDETSHGEPDAQLTHILHHLYRKVNVDFSQYKMATINRRLIHRMSQRGIETSKEYVKLLKKEKKETDLLYKDLLIHVTGFFRDTETFEFLKSAFLPKLLKEKTSTETIRLWVVACSSGEEAYSIAMLLHELQQSKKTKIPIKIFATDLSEQVIREARAGRYSENDVKNISKQRMERYFTKSNGAYHISKALREMCVFATHNILSDPPFFGMDFISCRNLLIYFDVAAQKKALAILHYSLNEGSYLMLGKAETIAVMPQLFKQFNSKFKIYSTKKELGIRKVPELTPNFSRTSTLKKNTLSVLSKSTSHVSSELDSAINSILLAEYIPPCAIINQDMEILQFRGLTKDFLAHGSGKASLNILKMVRSELAFELRIAVEKALKTKELVHKPDIEIKINSTYRLVSLDVIPLTVEWSDSLLLVVFTLQDQTVATASAHSNKSNPKKDLVIRKLSHELNIARIQMSGLIEAQEKAYEELQVASEEIVSSNEEFQALNEELETSKEEIEATNEELTITNQELKTHNELLAESYDFSQTVFATIHEPLLILDSNLVVKSANNAFCKKFLVTQKETQGMCLFKLGNKQWNISKLRQLLGRLLTQNKNLENFELIHTFPGGLGEKIMVLNASRILQKTHREELILLAIEDVTERTRYHLKENELLKADIISKEAAKVELEKAVTLRTKQLHEKNRELELANKDLIAFAFISSHDLQEPLRKIQNFISLIQEDQDKILSANSALHLQKTADTATRMRKLIEDLLSYSGVTQREKIFEKRSLHDLFNDVAKNLQENIREHGATITLGDLGEAPVIDFQIRQLFDNLVCNSLKFKKPDVPLHISIRSKIVSGSPLKNGKLFSKEKYRHITYTDNGIGFDPIYNERIFEVFQRLHSRERYKGTGIGLAICKRIVENHNGLITATGKENKGVTFDIYLPVEI